MAKIARLDANYLAFAINALAGERTVFGDVTDSDTLDDNFTTDFLRGWGIVGTSDFPTKQDFNAAFFTLGQTLAYLHQMGIAEWNVNQEYHQGAKSIGSDFLIYTLNVASDTGTNPVGDVTGTWKLSDSAFLANAGATYQDSGSANAYVLALSTNLQSVDSYKDGMTVTFKAGNSNTGPSTVNINGLGVKSITRSDGSALVAGDINAGEYNQFTYNLASDRFEISMVQVEFATQADQEGLAEAGKAVTPSVQQYHPSAAKAFAAFNGIGVVSLEESYNVSGIIDNGTGDYTITFSNAMSAATYGYSVASESNVVAPAGASLYPGGRATGSIRVLTWQGAGPGITDSKGSLTVYGDR